MERVRNCNLPFLISFLGLYVSKSNNSENFIRAFISKFRIACRSGHIIRKGICKISCSHNLPFSARTSVVAFPPLLPLSVKKVPILLPRRMVFIALSCIPLQITTHTPRSSAHAADFTLTQQCNKQTEKKKDLVYYDVGAIQLWCYTDVQVQFQLH